MFSFAKQMKVTAEIITIGDEILIGQIVNTNAVWLSQNLNNAGVWVKKITSVGDNENQIVGSLENALKNNQIVIITGGLGPTNDDLTKNTLQKFYKTGLKKEEDVEKFIKATFEKFNVEFLPANEQQAYILANSSLLFNHHGTAPGMWIDQDEKTVIVLPGVPNEMKGIMSDYVFDKIKSKYQLPEILHRTIVTYGIPESTLAQILEKIENTLPSSIKLAYLPKFRSVRLRLTTIEEKIANNLSEIDRFFSEILANIPPENIIATEDISLEEIIGKLLKKNNKTLSVAESCTGGNISHLITSVSGCSEYFKGSVTCYDNSIKIKVLNVAEETILKYGAVSEQCVIQMAEGVRKLMKTDFSISTSGIAGPDGGTDEKPVGMVWIAVNSNEKTITKKLQLRGNRQTVIENASNAALEMLRQVLIQIKQV